MLERATRPTKARAASRFGACFWAAPASKDLRGALDTWPPWGVGRGERMFGRASRRSAPRALTVQRISSERMFVEGERAA